MVSVPVTRMGNLTLFSLDEHQYANAEEFWVQRFKGSEVQGFRGSGVQRFKGSEVQVSVIRCQVSGFRIVFLFK